MAPSSFSPSRQSPLPPAQLSRLVVPAGMLLLAVLAGCGKGDAQQAATACAK